MSPTRRFPRVESPQFSAYTGCLRGDHSTPHRRAAAAALCLVATLPMGVASARAQTPTPDPAPVPSPTPQPKPAPTAPPPLVTPTQVGTAQSSPAPAPKRKSGKRKKPVPHQPPAVVYSSPLHEPPAVASVAPAARDFIDPVQADLTQPDPSRPDEISWFDPVLLLFLGGFGLTLAFLGVIAAQSRRGSRAGRGQRSASSGVRRRV